MFVIDTLSIIDATTGQPFELLVIVTPWVTVPFTVPVPTIFAVYCIIVPFVK
jgi:hypothetical protein